MAEYPSNIQLQTNFTTVRERETERERERGCGCGCTSLCQDDFTLNVQTANNTNNPSPKYASTEVRKLPKQSTQHRRLAYIDESMVMT